MLPTIFTYKIYIADNFLGYEYAESSAQACQGAFAQGRCASGYAGVDASQIRAVKIIL
jgi:hypothetical protein